MLFGFEEYARAIEESAECIVAYGDCFVCLGLYFWSRCAATYAAGCVDAVNLVPESAVDKLIQQAPAPFDHKGACLMPIEPLYNLLCFAPFGHDTYIFQVVLTLVAQVVENNRPLAVVKKAKVLV